MPESASQYTPEFFTSEKALTRRFKTEGRRLAFNGTTHAEANAWQKKARRRLVQLLSLDRFEMCPAKPKKVESVEVDGITRETWHIQTERDVWMPYYLFIPGAAMQQPAPLVLCPHGHGSAGKWATGGRTDIPAMVPVIRSFNYDYGVQLARAGFITACPDARGFGERREPAVQGDRDNANYLFTSSCHQLTLAGAPLGLSVQGMWTWDLMRLVDHLSDDPRIDSARIGCAGLSGGGLQTLALSAVDTRIKAAIVSGYFYGVRESLLTLNSNCLCNMVPNLWEDFDMGDMGALIAPRGLFIETGNEDPLNGASKLANVRSQVAISRKVYKAMNASPQLQHHVFEGEHLWNGTRSIPWIQQQLL
jgi:dienelactone hydrolase